MILAAELGLRTATIDDLPHRMFTRLEAQDGMNEALLENLQLSVEEIITRELRDLQSFESFQNYWVAELEGEVDGGIQLFPFDLLNSQPYSSIIPEERLYIERPCEALQALEPTMFRRLRYILPTCSEVLRPNLSSMTIT